MKLISKRYPLRFEKEKAYPMNAIVVNRYLRSTKQELTSYYDAFFSRKAAPPICLSLCGMIIVAYFFGSI